MKQREVQDSENVKWQCVQAHAGITSKAAEEAAAKVQNESGNVTVVCTPSGGAQTVRLELQEDWNEQMSDEALIDMITKITSQRGDNNKKETTASA
jgi:hypothetical protein